VVQNTSTAYKLIGVIVAIMLDWYLNIYLAQLKLLCWLQPSAAK